MNRRIWMGAFAVGLLTAVLVWKPIPRDPTDSVPVTRMQEAEEDTAGVTVSLQRQAAAPLQVPTRTDASPVAIATRANGGQIAPEAGAPLVAPLVRSADRQAHDEMQRSPESPASPEREVPLHWQVTGLGRDHYRMSTERAVVWDGSASVELAPLADAYDVSWGALWQMAAADPFRGKRIEFSAYLRTQDVQGGSGLWFRADDGEGTTGVAFDNMSSRWIREDHAWARCSIVLDIPPDAATIHYGIIQVGRGSTWFDDARFEVVDRSVEVSAPPIRRRFAPIRAPIRPAREVPATPRNLGFEETVVLSEPELY